MLASHSHPVNNNYILYSGALLIILGFMIATPTWSHNNPQGPCNEIKDDTERLACFDLGHHKQEAETKTEAIVYRPTLEGPPTHETLVAAFGLKEKDLAIRIPTEYQLKRIESVIVKTEIADDGTHVIELENGQVWKENQPGRGRIKANQGVKISKNVMSYRLNPDTGRSVTVNRIK